ncbi:hypothetical protein [Enorma shizhengliae]|uniref:hypothetical protein n=1 Tax=Enorma shizhengliae TaxID=2606615 RepID=UPI001C554CC0|nr:hypothetical protein [Enorma shizhengliae]
MVDCAVRKLQADEALVAQWSPMLLKMTLDRWLWKEKDAIQVKQLWTQLCSYCYLPRLASFSVLERTIREGSASGEFFAVASGVEGDRYINLTLGSERLGIHDADWLVKPPVAREQLERERNPSQGEDVVLTPPVLKPGTDTSSSNGNGGGMRPPIAPAERRPVEFIMDKPLDSVRVNRDVPEVIDEIVSHFEREGARVELILHVEAHSDDGFDVPLVRTITENCRTLGITFEFNE